MDQPGLRLGASAAAKAILAIGGLLGGLGVGAAFATIRGMADFDAIRIVVKGGLVGSFVGMAAAIVAAIGMKAGLTTVRGLAWLVGIAAIVLFLYVSIP